MKVLYAIQGTGNGHLTRACDIVPLLEKRCELDIMISGIQCDIQAPFDIKYRRRGAGFIFGKKGGVDFKETWRQNHSKQIRKEIKSLPVEDYDLIINDFEPISAWAARRKKVPCVSLSHQSAVISSSTPKPKKRDHFGEFILKNYAPCDRSYGFHFKQYDDYIYTPVIRQLIRNIEPSNQGHYTVYLPAYDDAKLIARLSRFKSVKWQVFSKHNKLPVSIGNVDVQPVNNEKFIASMASCEGILCGAGFETPAEALFLNKKLMVIPMRAQYEQQLNAAALKEMGVPVIKSLKRKHFNKIDDWLCSDQRIEVNYPDNIADIVEHVLHENTIAQNSVHPFLLPEIEIA